MQDGLPDRAQEQPAIGRYVIQTVVLAALYYLAARASLRIALVDDTITPLWPPTGIALVAFLRYGRRLWPGIAVAALLVNLPITNPSAALLAAAGNTLAPLAVAVLLDRLRFRMTMDRVRDVGALVAAALAGMTISATVGSVALVITSEIPADRFWPAWSVWWAGDAMGVLVVAPFLLTLITWPRGRTRVPWSAAITAAGLFVLLVAASVLSERTDGRLLFLIPPVVGWVAWRFQLRGAAPAVLLISVLAVRGAVRGTGAFADVSLAEAMLTLQTFNATIAFSAFFLSALVTERIRDRERLERSAVGLEGRVQDRTRELTRANTRLQSEISVRRRTEGKLRQKERDLAEAQELARLGRWEWDLEGDEIIWSDEMFRIHGAEPQSFRVTFDRALELVVDADRRRIERNVADGLERRLRELPQLEYRIVRPDGERRTLLGRARIFPGSDGAPRRMMGVLLDVTERREYERQHEIADTLQLALLPHDLPIVEGLATAAQYVPAEEGFKAGGDWYDAIPLPDGRLGLVIGDVAGHGLEAASIMGQLRMAVRAYALEGHRPTDVVAHAHTVLRAVEPDELATMLYVELDPDSGTAAMVCAGHPRPLVVSAGGARYLEPAIGAPIGIMGTGRYSEQTFRLTPGDVLLLYTDGLVDHRGVPLDDAAERLLQEARDHHQRGDSIGELCARLATALAPPPAADDVAILALQVLPIDAERLQVRFPAEPQELAGARRALGRWLRARHVDDDDVQDLVLALSEACTNAIKHAYGPVPGWVEIEARHDEHLVTVEVRDFGHWRPKRGAGGGLGLSVIEATTASVEIERRSDGTSVRMQKWLRQEVPV